MEATQKKFTTVGFDYLVYPRLHTAGIILFKGAAASSVEGITKEAEREILNRHQMTAINFIKYCLDTMINVFVRADKPSEMPEYLFIIASILGYKQGTAELLKTKKMKSYPDFSKIASLFSKEEFEQIGELIKETLIQFPDQCRKSMEWMVEHPPHAAIQINAMAAFVKALQEKKSPEEIEKIAKKAGEEALPELLGEHSLWKIQKREQLGLLSPGKEMIETMERIMNMFDVMHYGGYVNTSAESIDPALITFEKWF